MGVMRCGTTVRHVVAKLGDCKVGVTSSRLAIYTLTATDDIIS